MKWTRLRLFIEKELRVQEEMSLIKKLDVSSESKEKRPPVQRDRSYNRNGYVAGHNGGDDDMKCSFCNEAGHVLTADAKRSKLVQNFACKMFVHMTPAQ